MGSSISIGDRNTTDVSVQSENKKELSPDEAKKLLVSSGFMSDETAKNLTVDNITTVDRIVDGDSYKMNLCENNGSDCSTLFVSESGRLLFDMTDQIREQKEEEEKEKQKKWILTTTNDVGDKVGTRSNYTTKEECFSAGNFNLFDASKKTLGVKYFECGYNCKVIDNTEDYDSTTAVDIFFANFISCEEVCNAAGCR